MARPNGRDVARALEAAREGDDATLRLLTTGRKVASAPQVLGEALRAAAESGHVDVLKALLQFGAPAAGAPGADQDRTPLVAACAGGHTECVEALLAHGAQDNVISLTSALDGDHSGCLHAVVMSNASLNPRTLARLPALLCAAAGCDAVACMDELCRLGCDPCTEGLASIGSPLRTACEVGSTRAVAWLLEHGAPVDAAPHPERETALHAACACGNADCAALLIRHGASVDLADHSGETPLAAALKGDHATCVALLLDHGARAAADCLIGLGGNSRDSHSWDLVPRLLAAGADCDCQEQQFGLTPLAMAARRGTFAALRALCAAGADARAAGTGGRLPIHWVATRFVQLSRTELEDATAAATLLSGHIEDALACADELIERTRAERLLAASTGQFRSTALQLGLGMLAVASGDGVLGNSVLQQLKDGYVALLLARWPLSAPLPEYNGIGALLPAAFGHAQRRLEVLSSGRGDDAGLQQALTAAFLRCVRDACGGAVAPDRAPFARLRFVSGGGLDRAWAGVREVHRFPVERVALARATLQVASDAQAAAAERCVPLLRELSAANSSSCGSWEAEKLRYAAAVAVGRWGAIRAAVSRAEEGLRSSEDALDAAVAEAEAQVGRLQEKAAAEAAASRAAAPAG